MKKFTINSSWGSHVSQMTNKLAVVGGDVFGALTVLFETYKSLPSGYVRSAACLCECGREVVVKVAKLHSGHTKSCGCLRKKQQRLHWPKTEAYEKYCVKCQLTKSTLAFARDRRKADQLFSSCRTCNREFRDNYSKYGISLETYAELSEKQNNKCAICEKVCSSGRKLAVDHNHKTDKVRALLCVKCNMALGGFEDNVTTMLRAIEYLKEHGDYNA